MNTRPELAEPLARVSDFSAFDEAAQGGSLVPAGQVLVQTQGREVTARKVAAPRSMREILATLKVYCAQFGETYTYSWQANDRQNNRKVTVEGGTIKLANDLVMLYGNCAVDCDVTQTATHWIFKAFFIDYERGVTYSRLFQQRTSQSVGMRGDDGRQADIVFQIGQSKAIRNVVLNALASLSNFAIEESKRGLIEVFTDEKKREQAWAFIDRVKEEHNISDIRIEAVVGRKLDKLTIRDLARVYTEMRGIHEGLTIADEVYPTEEEARVVQGRKEAKDEAGRQRDPDANTGSQSAGRTAEGQRTPPAENNPPPQEEQRAEPAQPAAATAANPAKPAATAGDDSHLTDIPAFLDRSKNKGGAQAAAPTKQKADDDSLFGEEG